jgi:NAD(P)-dependent dehydrogenase (short-subunit alcohol dehydrogenase family)
MAQGPGDAQMWGKVAIVTGAGRGIGKAIALSLAGKGASVVLVSRTAAELEQCLREVRVLTRNGIAVAADVSIKEQVDHVVSNTRAEFGHVDILVNNAGIAVHSDLKNIGEEDWDRTFAVNLKGTFLFSQAVFRFMSANGGGDIINIASMGGRRSAGHYSAYCASKAGMIAFSEAIAQEGKPENVRVSLVCPGPVATWLRKKDFPNEDSAALLQPEDVAEVVLFLLSRPKGVHIPEICVQASGLP